ncbi:hypothetical protein B0T24DRAFT_725243 [Lasiosphaeria ovina]|uniref:CCHC-type domain-containing protein n=1 Tax=Lasiosphaeria ovina TaxID=92902 RepID=A0AAE0MY89_9PEZI|nr:hypothetical protein B0T24DRAFT_725243 [Lasiosphaeria ovina]
MLDKATQLKGAIEGNREVHHKLKTLRNQVIWAQSFGHKKRIIRRPKRVRNDHGARDAPAAATTDEPPAGTIAKGNRESFGHRKGIIRRPKRVRNDHGARDAPAAATTDEPPAGTIANPPPGPSPGPNETCGNCGIVGHEVAMCIDCHALSGDIAACPFCNASGHLVEQCPRLAAQEVPEEVKRRG